MPDSDELALASITDPDPLEPDEQAVLQTIARLSAHSRDPKLSEEDLDDAIDRCRRPDASGRTYGDEGWEPTYDINVAVAFCWETKAARAAGDFRFEEDNQSFYREQVYRACRQQADRYNRRCVAVPVVAGQ